MLGEQQENSDLLGWPLLSSPAAWVLRVLMMHQEKPPTLAKGNLNSTVTRDNTRMIE